MYQSPGDQTAEEGTDLVVELSVNANPYPETFTWLKDRVDVVPNESVMVGVDYIRFIELTTDDAGTYSFNTSNSEGPGSEVSFELDVQCTSTLLFMNDIIAKGRNQCVYLIRVNTFQPFEL